MTQNKVVRAWNCGENVHSSLVIYFSLLSLVERALTVPVSVYMYALRLEFHFQLQFTMINYYFTCWSTTSACTCSAVPVVL